MTGITPNPDRFGLGPARLDGATLASPDDIANSGLSFSDRVGRAWAGLPAGRAPDLGQVAYDWTVAGGGSLAAPGAAAVASEVSATIDQRAVLADLFDAASTEARRTSNSASEAASIEDAFATRIRRLEEASGITLENPRRQGYEDRARAAYEAMRAARPSDWEGVSYGEGWHHARLRLADDAFFADYNAALERLTPEQLARMPVTGTTVGEEGLALARASLPRAAAARAAAYDASPIAAATTDFAAGMVGGARDPLFWLSFGLGPGAGAGKTALARIGNAALKQGAANAAFAAANVKGSEAWRDAVGMDTSAGAVATEIGIAALFGAVPGGALQAGGELVAARAAAARLKAGRPQAGDVAAVAEALRLDLGSELDTVLAAERAAADDAVAAGSPPGLVDPAEHAATLQEHIAAVEAPGSEPAPMVLPLDPSPAPSAAAVKRRWREASPFTDIEDMLRAAPRHQAALAAAGEALAAATDGVAFLNPGVKALAADVFEALPAGEAKDKAARGRARFAEKAGAAARPGAVTDLVRGGFVTPRPQAADDIVAGLRSRFEAIDEGWYRTPFGYYDRKLYLRFDDGLIGEVQILEPGLKAAKKQGHKLYAEARSLSDADPRKAALEQQMRAVYSAAWDALSPEWRAAIEGSGGSAGASSAMIASATNENSPVTARPFMPTSVELTRTQEPPRSTNADPGAQIAGSPSKSTISQPSRMDGTSRPIGDTSGANSQVISQLGRPVHVVALPARDLRTAAREFQYKDGGDAAGVTGRLRDVLVWDRTASGKALMYEFADGRLVVADGHQRLGLARRLDTDADPIVLDGFLYREADGWTVADVRALAARKNMQEDSGSALDAARILRDRPDLLDGSLPITSPKMKAARALAHLSDTAWGMVVNGVAPERDAALVGAMVATPDHHAAILADLARADLATEREARMFVTEALEAGITAAEQIDMFGASLSARTLVAERVKVLTRALGLLKGDRKLFGLVAGRADDLADAGNVIDRAASASRADNAAMIVELVERLARRSGPLSDNLSRAARLVADGGSAEAAAKMFVADVRAAVDAGGVNALLVEPARLDVPAPVEPGRVDPEAVMADLFAAPADVVPADVAPRTDAAAPPSSAASEPPPLTGPASTDLFDAVIEDVDAVARAVDHADLLKACKP